MKGQALAPPASFEGDARQAVIGSWPDVGACRVEEEVTALSEQLKGSSTIADGSDCRFLPSSRGEQEDVALRV
jgi:hypothetical protein